VSEPRGPKEKYTPEACEAVIAVAASGGHIPAMIIAAGARSKTTFYTWQDKHPEFKEACEYAKIVSQEFYEDLGVKGITGQIDKFNATTFCLLMNNKFGDEYKRSGTGNHTDINITNTTLNLSDDEVKAKIIQKLQNISNLGDDVGQYKQLTIEAEPIRVITAPGDEGTPS